MKKLLVFVAVVFYSAVKINAQIQIVSSGNKSVCPGEKVTIWIDTSNTDGSVQISWRNNQGQQISTNQKSIDVTSNSMPGAIDVYHAAITYNTLVYNVDISVTSINQPTKIVRKSNGINIDDASVICYDENLRLALDIPIDAEYRWLYNDIPLIEHVKEITPTKPGIYTLQIKGGCTVNSAFTFNTESKIHYPVKISVQPKLNQRILGAENAYLVIEYTGSPKPSIEWQQQTGGTPWMTVQPQNHQYNFDGIYRDTLIINPHNEKITSRKYKAILSLNSMKCEQRYTSDEATINHAIPFSKNTIRYYNNKKEEELGANVAIAVEAGENDTLIYEIIDPEIKKPYKLGDIVNLTRPDAVSFYTGTAIVSAAIHPSLFDKTQLTIPLKSLKNEKIQNNALIKIISSYISDGNSGYVYHDTTYFRYKKPLINLIASIQHDGELRDTYENIVKLRANQLEEYLNNTIGSRNDYANEDNFLLIALAKNGVILDRDDTDIDSVILIPHASTSERYKPQLDKFDSKYTRVALSPIEKYTTGTLIEAVIYYSDGNSVISKSKFFKKYQDWELYGAKGFWLPTLSLVGFNPIDFKFFDSLKVTYIPISLAWGARYYPSANSMYWGLSVTGNGNTILNPSKSDLGAITNISLSLLCDIGGYAYIGVGGNFGIKSFSIIAGLPPEIINYLKGFITTRP